MSSIEQLGTDRWRARVAGPSVRQKAKTFTHKHFADHFMRRLRRRDGLVLAVAARGGGQRLGALRAHAKINAEMSGQIP
jgi:hypothetical protein